MSPDPEVDIPTSTIRNDLLAETFVSLADTLVDDYDVVEVLHNLVHVCVRLLDISEAGLLLIDQRGSLQLVASSSEPMRLLELFQLQAEEGPCVDSVRTGEPVTIADVEAASIRWPRFAPAAVDAGFRSVHAVPLRLRSQTIGGLNLFGAEARLLGGEDQRAAQALADVATIGILQQRSVHRASLVAEQLQAALTSRVIIEQGKGVLLGHAEVTLDEAFSALRNYARDNNRKISDVAQDVVRRIIPAESLLPRRRPE